MQYFTKCFHYSPCKRFSEQPCGGREDSPYSADEQTKVRRGKETSPSRAGTRSSDSYLPDLSLLLPQNLKFTFLLFWFHTYFKEDREIELRNLSLQREEVQVCTFTKCLFLFPQRDYLISHRLYWSPKAAFSAYSGCQEFYRIGSCIHWCRDAPGSPWVIHSGHRLGREEAGPFPGRAGWGSRLPRGPADLTGLGPGPWALGRTAPLAGSHTTPGLLPLWVKGRSFISFCTYSFCGCFETKVWK